MCATCGCADEGDVRVTVVDQAHAHNHNDANDHAHEHSHDHAHAHPHPEPAKSRTQLLELNILAKNDDLAADNRLWLASRSITALNLMSSPGSGKTTLLVRTLRDLASERAVAVIEGDQETWLDADRISATGAPVVQVNTGAGCHLDAEMMRSALDHLSLKDNSILFIENVGNLVCPAMFDLGESAKVVVISVTEGADKPLKYPQMFAGADLMIVNKVDLLPYVDFDVDACIRNARQVNPDLQSIALSATTGDGMAQWYGWIETLTSR
jgi:hydrogenase nickel incorporation protein HypB